METLATYFGLGQQTHRSLDDVRMNLEVLKYCATVLFLESGLPGILTENSLRCTGFVDPDDVSIPSLSVTPKIQISHENFPLQLSCKCLKVRFGINSKFVDHAGWPRLSIVVNALPSLCNILEASDNLAQKLFMDSGSLSHWWRVVSIKPGYDNSPTVRLQIPTVADRDTIRCTTEIYQKDASFIQRFVFSTSDFEELHSLLTPGILVDAFFSLDSYDYKQNAGLRLVARKLIVHSA